MSSLFAGFKFHILARIGLSTQVPPAKLGEMLWDADTKVFRVGDDTTTPPRIMSEKSIGTFDFSNTTNIKFGEVSIEVDKRVDGVNLKTLTTATGFTYHFGQGAFGNVILDSDTLDIGNVEPDSEGTYKLKL